MTDDSSRGLDGDFEGESGSRPGRRRRRFVLRTGWSSLVVLAGLTLGAFSLGGCGSSESGLASSQKVLLIGVDGMSWDVLKPLLQEGRLPNLQRLVDGGYSARLATMPPPSLSPIIWTTIATGRHASDHGIHNFLFRDPVTGEQHPYTSDMRKVRAFWNILSEEERSVGVVGWWVSWPAEPVEGVVVTSYSAMKVAKRLWKGQVYKGFERQTYPDEFMGEVLAPIIDECEGSVNQKLAERIFGRVHGDRLNEIQRLVVDDTRSVFLSDEIYGRVGEYLLKERSELDVVAVYFAGTDVSSHRFWKYYEPDGLAKFESSDEELQMLGEVIPEYYEYIDGVVGRLVEEDPERLLILCSDHGFHAEMRRGMSQDERSGGHETRDLPGVVILNGPGVLQKDRTEVRDPSRLPSIYDILPTLLYVQGLSTARDMPGRVIREAFEENVFLDRPIESRATYETSPWEPKRAPARPSTLEGAVQERLRSLGYIMNVPAKEKKKKPNSPQE